MVSVYSQAWIIEVVKRISVNSSCYSATIAACASVRPLVGQLRLCGGGRAKTVVMQPNVNLKENHMSYRCFTEVVF